MPRRSTLTLDRRSDIRIAPPGVMRIDSANPGSSIADASILNISKGGVALRSDVPVAVGEHLMFITGFQSAPVHCQVLQCQPDDAGSYHVRCRCIMGGFDLG